MTTMNGSEARILLKTLLQPYREVGYRQLRRMVGHNEILETRGPTGARYRLECFVSRVRDEADTLSVSAIASQAGARRWLPGQVSIGFSVMSDGSIH